MTSNSLRHIDVVLVADVDEPHCVVVAGHLEAMGARTLRLNLSDLATTTLVAQAGALDIAENGSWSRVDRETTLWWFRAGRPSAPEGVEADEAQLILDETPAVFVGSFRAAGVRWVDDPDLIGRAEWKLGQLAVAADLGISTPRWRATNDPTSVQQFADGQPVIAKPLSAGRGIAPYVATVSAEEMADPGKLVTLFQQRLDASADIRVVVVDGQSWVWRRNREAGTVNWRAVDPHGNGFCLTSADVVGTAPCRVTSALGLTMSVQDWLETDEGPVFLEANPQGGWLFLDNAETTVAPALAQHLRDGPWETPGSWPEPRRRAFYDFLPENRAPAADGLKAPCFPAPVWADEVAPIAGALDVARAAREGAEDAAKSAEDKASRLVQVTLTFLTVSLALGSYQLTFSLERSWPWLFLLLPVALALAFLSFAAFEAMTIDRVGFYYQPSAQDLSGIGQRDPNAVLLAGEERGRRLARWSANHKHTDLMQARAWFIRGLAALLMAGLAAGICRATASASSHSGEASPVAIVPSGSAGGVTRPALTCRWSARSDRAVCSARRLTHVRSGNQATAPYSP